MLFMGKSIISTGPFSIAMLNNHRVILSATLIRCRLYFPQGVVLPPLTGVNNKRGIVIPQKLVDPQGRGYVLGTNQHELLVVFAKPKEGGDCLKIDL